MDTFLTLTFPTNAGMFMELVAKPIPNAMADSMPKNSATSRSSSSWMLKLPMKKDKEMYKMALLGLFPLYNKWKQEMSQARVPQLNMTGTHVLTASFNHKTSESEEKIKRLNLLEIINTLRRLLNK